MRKHLSHSHARRALTFGLAAAGTALFWSLDLPLPFLFGPMAFCLAGAKAHLPRMALSVALIPIFIAVIAAIGVPLFRKLWGFDAPTSYHAACMLLKALFIDPHL